MRLFTYYPLWARLGISLGLGSLFGISKSYHVKHYLQQKKATATPTILEQTHDDSISDDDVEFVVKNTQHIIRQAFEDAGFKGDLQVGIKVDLKALQPNSPFGANCIGHMDKFNHRAARFELTSFPTKIEDRPQFMRELYAVGGHEAIHALHHHAILPDMLQGALFGFAPVFSLIFLFQVNSAFLKLCEIDADLTSAHKLGTAQALIGVFQRYQNYLKNQPELELETHTHPSFNARIKYLSWFQQYRAVQSKPLASHMDEPAKVKNTP